MKRSLNEVTGYLKKAACGAGYGVGLSEDIARAGIALIESGQDGIAAVAQIMPDQAGTDLSRTALAGPSVFERLIGGEQEVRSDGVDAPLLVVGFALAAAREHQKGFRLSYPDGNFLLAGPDGFSGELPAANTGHAMVVTMADLDTIASGQPGFPKIRIKPCLDGVEVNEALLPLLKDWAMQTCVPASEASRLSGAGAGLTDND